MTSLADAGRPRSGGFRRRPHVRRRAIGAMLRADLRLLGREPVTALLLLAPLLLAAATRWGIDPLLEAVARGGLDPTGWRRVAIGMFAAAVAPAIGGSIVALMLAADRDAATLLALRTSPLTLGGYLAYRSAVAAAFGAGACLLVLLAGGAPAVALVAVAPSGLVAPTVALSVAAVARNKVEALAIVKLLTLPLVAPAALLAITSPAAAATVALSLSPTWWGMTVLAAALPRSGEADVAAVFGAGATGMFVATALLALSWRWARRRLSS